MRFALSLLALVLPFAACGGGESISPSTSSTSSSGGGASSSSTSSSTSSTSSSASSTSSSTSSASSSGSGGAPSGCTLGLPGPPSLAVGEHPAAMVTADLDGDGRPDLAVANHGSDTVSVIRALGNGAFAPAVHFDAGHAPVAIAAADLDGDGLVDLVVADDTDHALSVLRNLGGAAFAMPVKIALGAVPSAIATGDLDGDGRPEIIVTTGSFGNAALHQLLNDGGLSFHEAPVHPLKTDEAPLSLAVADLDGDGLLDVAVGSIKALVGGRITLLANQGAGQLGPGVELAGERAAFLVLADLNGDGRPDLVSTDPDPDGLQSSFRVRLNDGSGGFLSPQTFAHPEPPRRAAVGDATGDGLPDVVVDYQWGFAVYPNLGSGTIGAPIAYGTAMFPGDVVLADLDGDGDLDLATPERDRAHVAVVMNQGGGVFVPRSPVGPAMHGVAALDADGDGRVDLAVTHGHDAFTSGVSVLLQAADGTFGAPAFTSLPNTVGAIVGADLDGDGLGDLVLMGGTNGFNADQVRVLRGKGDGTFAPPVTYPLGMLADRVISADIDGDGKLDLVTTSLEDETLRVLLGHGDGTFGAPQIVVAGVRPRGLAAGDVDGDGHVDLAVGDFTNDEVAILRNTGGGAFAAPIIHHVAMYNNDVVLADLDGDGKLDLAVAVEALADNILVLHGDGAGGFSAPASFTASSYPFALAAVDLDGDGKPDLAWVDGEIVGVLLNRNDSIFSGEQAYTAGVQPIGLLAADLDGDGHRELVVPNLTSGDVSILRAACLP